jgi:hypothetical protein
VYSTFAEADGRKYRDAVAYGESNFRSPKPVPDDQRQRQARDARHDARVLSNDPTEARRRKEQQDQEATAAAGDAMKQQYKRKSTLRDPAPEKEEDPKAKQKRVDAVEQAAFGLPASVYSPPPKNAAERHHRAAIKKRLAQGSEAMDTLNNQIEALVAANQKLTDKKLDVTATTFGASGGGAEGGGGAGGGGGGGGAGSGPAHDGSSDFAARGLHMHNQHVKIYLQRRLLVCTQAQPTPGHSGTARLRRSHARVRGPHANVGEEQAQRVRVCRQPAE